MLLDEPFGALDPLTRDRIQQSFRRIRERLGLTAIFVTHDMSEALLLGDRIAVMRAGRCCRSGRRASCRLPGGRGGARDRRDAAAASRGRGRAARPATDPR